MARKEPSAEIQENGFSFPRAAHWSLRAGNGYKLLNDSTADHEALASIFSDPGKFYVADPYTFLFASLMVLIFGAGLYSVDTLIARHLKASKQRVPGVLCAAERQNCRAKFLARTANRREPIKSIVFLRSNSVTFRGSGRRIIEFYPVCGRSHRPLVR